MQVPWGLRKLLQWLKTEYNDPAILITANGISESGDSNEANDWWRKQYFVGYINEMMKGKTELQIFISFCSNLLFRKF